MLTCNFHESEKVVDGWKFGVTYAYNGSFENVVSFGDINKAIIILKKGNYISQYWKMKRVNVNKT